MKNQICFVEITFKDFEKGNNFYNSLFGWNMKEGEHNNLKYAELPSEAISEKVMGHLMECPEASDKSWATIYILVDSVEKYLKKAETLGGKTIVPYTEIEKMGAFGMFLDPEEHLIGLWEEFKKQ